jgi:hypothetical protein
MLAASALTIGPHEDMGVMRDTSSVLYPGRCQPLAGPTATGG